MMKGDVKEVFEYIEENIDELEGAFFEDDEEELGYEDTQDYTALGC